MHKYLLGNLILLYYAFICRDRRLAEYRAFRTNGDHILASNLVLIGLLGIPFPALYGGLGVWMMLLLSFAFTWIGWSSAKPAAAFLKSRHGNVWVQARWESWWANRKDREAYLEEIYFYSRSVYEAWKADGGEEREAERRRRKEQAREESARAARDEQFRQRAQRQEAQQESRERPNFDRQERAGADQEAGLQPHERALRTFELPLDTRDFGMIRSRYRTLIKTHHPDVGGDLEYCKRINLAYEVLQNTYGGLKRAN